MLITRHSCPFCNSKFIAKYLTTADYSHTHQPFEIWNCNTCTGRFTQSVPNEATIGKYYDFDGYVSHNNQAKGLINKLYLQARKYTLKQKINWLKKYVNHKNFTLADIGAGTGAFVHQAMQNNINVQGFEPDNNARQVALNTLNVTLKNTSHWFTNSHKYDAITLWHVLEHLHNLDTYMQSFYNNLNANGKLFIAVPNFNSNDAATYQQYWAAYDVPRHLYHFNSQSMHQLAQKFGFTVTTVLPMWLDGYYVSMLSEKHRKATFNFVKGLFNGGITHLKTIGNKYKASSLVYILTKNN